MVNNSMSRLPAALKIYGLFVNGKFNAYLCTQNSATVAVVIGQISLATAVDFGLRSNSAIAQLR